ncbi:helix-turn-helix domain-containing protein [Halobium palmae]|uniref:Helix-turn-helix domain-containing protein n=1 Tax=Halobium palmae TaxID=1776492 RepID=A0ABD5RUL5_9EURY
MKVEVEMASTDLALDHTTHVVPDINIKIVTSALASPDQSDLFLEIRTSDRTALHSALSEDATVLNPTLVTESPGGVLYRARWADHVRSTLQTLTDGTASLYSAHCSNRTWTLQLWLASHPELNSLSERWEEQNLEATIRSIQSNIDHFETTDSLTDLQYETLVTAYELGYFDVPRKVTMTDLAERFGVSQQTVSERLRRAHRQLIMERLLFDTDR